MFPSLGDQVGSCFKIARIRETKVVNDRIESLAKIRATEFLDLRFMLPGHHRQIPARPLSKLSEDCQLRCIFVVCSRFVGEVENFFRWTVFGVAMDVAMDVAMILLRPIKQSRMYGMRASTVISESIDGLK